MNEVKIYDWLRDYEYCELELTNDKEKNIVFAKILYHIHRKQHTSNINNITKYIMLDTLAYELDISKGELLNNLKILRSKKLIELYLDDFGFRITENNRGLAKAFGVSNGASRAKTKLTDIGETELKKICNKSNIPFLREYVLIIG